jgi:nucleotidyltransferase/DNA polymerase involved in DNA repair
MIGMQFNESERQRLLAVRGVGPTVVQRLEEAGISSLHDLPTRQAETLSRTIASSLGTSCWRNSPLALAALQGAIDEARKGVAAE